MTEASGVFIVLEGADGSGKTTQFKLLCERIKAVGHDIEIFDFPQYHSDSSHFIRQYLNGSYGEASSISPYTASLFYALDRYEAAPKIRSALKAGKVVISNRYVASNMAHQGAKFGTDGQKRGFFVWEDGIEYQMLQVPRPTFNIFLRVPAEVSYRLIKQRQLASSKKHLDQHEADIEHLKNAAYTYDLLAKLFPKDFKIINCVKEGELLSVPQISNQIWNEVKPILPPDPPRDGYETVLDLKNLTEAKQDKAEPKKKIQTNKQKDNFASSDSREQIEIKNISLFAANILKLSPNINVRTKLKWPSNHSNQGAYTFGNISNKLQSSYKQHNRQLSELYLSIKDKISANTRPGKLALIGITPLYALTDVEISGDRTEILNIAKSLQLNPSPEAKWLSGQLESAVRPKSDNLSQAIGSYSKNKSSDVIAKYAAKFEAKNASGSKIVHMINYWPKNEFELIDYSVFSSSKYPMQNISAELYNLSYVQKLELMKAVLEANLAHIHDEINYKLEIISPYTFIRILQKSGHLKSLTSQTPTAKIGYVIPETIKDADLSDEYEMCFTLCDDIYREFETAGKTELLPYLSLNNHLTRWQINLTASGLKALIDEKLPGTGKILNQIKESVEEIHPSISELLYSGKNVLNEASLKNPSRANQFKKP